ncbi:MAG TPA: hypothetical protein VL263_06115, partial [Vicinamibacterales bacterium]|nr:hypothetical protein [Vicinamibacterales bacterium]
MPDVLTPIETRPYLLEQIDDAAVVQLYADGFEALPLSDKVLVWHLYRAAIAGRDIYYDQRYRHNLPMRAMLEAVIRQPHGVPDAVLAEITRYTKLFWINSGPYNNLTARKFVLNVSEEAFASAVAHAASAGAALPLEVDETPADLVRRFAPMFFDAAFEPMVTNKTPGGGRDILEASSNNLYEGVTMADLEGYKEQHPVNSRLVKRDGAIVEEVYRVGGRYHDAIVRVISHLRDAAEVAPAGLRAALEALVRFYETGNDRDREAFDIAWVQNHDTSVDTMNGFIEVYMDARGVKGAWEGVVYYSNPEKTGKIRTLAANAQWFEDHMPIDPRYRKPVVQ